MCVLSFCSICPQKYMESLDIQISSSGFYTEADATLKKRIRRIVLASAGLVVLQQLCGANALIFHAEEVFSRLSPADDAPVRAPIYAIVLSVTQVNIICMYYAIFLPQIITGPVPLLQERIYNMFSHKFPCFQSHHSLPTIRTT